MRWLTLDIPKEQFVQIGRALDEVLVEMNWAPSKTQARKMIESGGIRINDEKITDTTARLALLDGEQVLILLKKEK